MASHFTSQKRKKYAEINVSSIPSLDLKWGLHEDDVSIHAPREGRDLPLYSSAGTTCSGFNPRAP